MILDFARRVALFTPPACATHTLHRVLCSPPFAAQCVIGPSCGTPGRFDRHTSVVPAEAETFDRAVAVRHPYARAVSLYLHDCRYRSGFGQPAPSWRDWFGELADGSQSDPFFGWSIPRHFLGAKLPGLLVRVEHLAADLKRLGYALESPLPCDNSSFYGRVARRSAGDQRPAWALWYGADAPTCVPLDQAARVLDEETLLLGYQLPTA